MEVENKNEFQIVFSEEAQSVSIKSDLPPKISADLEIRWFMKTDCVWYYKNGLLIEGRNCEDRVNLPIEELKSGNISLQEMLKNISKSDVGDYLCQVTREGRTEEITLSLKEASKTEMSHQTTTWIQNDKEWTHNDRMNMKESALLAVFSALEKSKRLQTDRQGDDDHNKPAAYQNNDQPVSPVIETSPSQPGEKSLGDQPLQCSDQGQSQSSNTSHKDTKKSRQSLVKRPKKEKKGATVFSILAGKMFDIHKKFIDDLKTRIEDLTEAHSVENSDVVLIFCPIVSRAGTDIDAALAKIQYPTASKLTVLVVLHHTFDPEKTISDSSKSVNKENLLTVDCLFYEDTGLLDCQRNSDAFNKSANWLIAQGHKIGVNISPQQSETSVQRFLNYIGVTKPEETPEKIDNEQQMTSTAVKVFMNVTGDVEDHHNDFINALKKQMCLRMVSTVEDSDVVLLFCSEIIGHKKTGKPVVLILLDCTIGPESDVSKRFLPVHCLVPEGKRLLDCQMNMKKISDISTFLKGYE